MNQQPSSNKDSAETPPKNNPKSTEPEQQHQVGHYLMLRTIGKGTFGRVKEAIHTITNEKAAVKVLNKNCIRDDEDRERLLREMEILRKVRHPNIIQLYEIMETNDDIYLALEYAEKGELFRLIIREERIKEQPAGRIFLQIVNAVEYLHRLGIAHRDLKPENVLLDFDYNVKLIDFGLSNYCQKSSMLKTACGSPCYAPPEMVDGKSYNGFVTDVWSMGIILYVMLCGNLPFQDKTTKELYKKIIAGKFFMPDHLSNDAQQAISAMLVTDPEKRIPLGKIRELSYFRRYASLEPSIYGLVVGLHPMPIDIDLLHQMKTLIKDMDVAKAEEDIRSNRHNFITASYYLLQKQVLREGGKTNVDLQLYLESNPDYQKDYGPRTAKPQSKVEPEPKKRDHSTESNSRYEKNIRSLLKKKPKPTLQERGSPPKELKQSIKRKFRLGDYTYLCRDYARRLNGSMAKDDSNRKFHSLSKSSAGSSAIKPPKKKPSLNQGSSEKKLRHSKLRLKTEAAKGKQDAFKETMDRTKETSMGRSLERKKEPPLQVKVWDAYFKNNLKSTVTSGQKQVRSNVKQRQKQELLRQNIRQIKECFTKLPELKSDRKNTEQQQPSEPSALETARL